MKPSDLGLSGDGFVTATDDIAQRLIANVEALEKAGKTYWCLTTPDPIVLMNFDRGTDGTLQQALKKGKHVVVSGMPQSEEDRRHHRLPSYSFAKPLLAKGQSTKDQSYAQGVAERARVAWRKFKEDYEQALASKAKTIVIDTGTGAYELARYAAFGKLTQVMPIMYSQVKLEFQGLIHRAYDTDKNVFWIHRLKPEWADAIDQKGNKNSVKTGRLERAGYSDMGFEVQANIRLDKYIGKLGKDKGKIHYRTTVLDCRLNSSVEGTTLEDEFSSFPFLAASIFENDPDDWE